MCVCVCVNVQLITSTSMNVPPATIALRRVTQHILLPYLQQKPTNVAQHDSNRVRDRRGHQGQFPIFLPGVARDQTEASDIYSTAEQPRDEARNEERPVVPVWARVNIKIYIISFDYFSLILAFPFPLPAPLFYFLLPLLPPPSLPTYQNCQTASRQKRTRRRH